MALEYINDVSRNKTSDDEPIIIKFNPWNYSDQNQLIIQFFRQLSVTLRQPDYPKVVKRAGEWLEIYGKLFEPFTFIPVVGPFAHIFSSMSKNIGAAAKAWENLKSNDLNSIRAELNQLLNKQPHKIVIVIDDIDRLNDTEIRQIFQLVKSLGDFPNTIYLVAFDKNVVINALMRVQEGCGREYLEKVVQIPFEVPLISKQEVEELLSSQLNQSLGGTVEAKWDHSYWSRIYNAGLKSFFRNIRDVNRYINTFQFGFEIVKDEVNPVDFLAITAIQVFMPEVFYGIRENKEIFSGIYYAHQGSDERRAQDKASCEEIISRAKEPSPKVLKGLLQILFPKLNSFYGNTAYGSEWLNEWRKECRICSPDVFDVFFRLSLPKGEISQKEIQNILSNAGKPELFSDDLLRLSNEQRIIRFLDRLEDYTASEIPLENIEPIISVLMDIGDLFPEDNAPFSLIDTSMRIIRLFHQMLQRFDSQEERFAILKTAMRNANRSLYTIVRNVGLLDDEQDKYSSKRPLIPEEDLIVNSKQLDELEKLACEKIENWAKDGRLAQHRNLPLILFRWKKWGQEDKLCRYMDSIIKSHDSLIDFIKFFSHSSSDDTGKTSLQVNLESIKHLVDLAKIEQELREISSSAEYKQLDDQKKAVVRAFLDTIDGKIKKPS